MFTNFTNGDIIYNRLFPLPFTDLSRNPYKYRLLYPTIFTNRADIYNSPQPCTSDVIMFFSIFHCHAGIND